MIDSIVRKVVDSYLETALWSSSDWDDMDDCDNPTPFDENYDIGDFTQEAFDKAREDCREFLDLLDAVEIDSERTLLDCADELQGYSRIGHDFWLTRNSHGAGFWDGDYRNRETGEDYGDSLTAIVKDNFGECNVWADGDGGVYFE